MQQIGNKDLSRPGAGRAQAQRAPLFLARFLLTTTLPTPLESSVL